eukprot:scaffold29043_cov36-Phaeocystis_antarctica.AAC.1
MWAHAAPAVAQLALRLAPSRSITPHPFSAHAGDRSSSATGSRSGSSTSATRRCEWSSQTAEVSS